MAEDVVEFADFKRAYPHCYFTILLLFANCTKMIDSFKINYDGATTTTTTTTTTATATATATTTATTPIPPASSPPITTAHPSSDELSTDILLLQDSSQE
jgi:hypothetical protein